MISNQLFAWIAFNAAVLLLLVTDLTLFHRQAREMRVREAMGWSVFWMVLAAGFNVLIYFMYKLHWGGFGMEPHEQQGMIEVLDGRQAALQFLTGYVIELSLSVDNLFVFLAIFKYFGVKGHHQHRVLFWGILGAVVLRAVMILVGVAVVERFHWLIYILGLFLIFTGAKLALEKSEEVDPEHNFVLKLARRLLPVSQGDHGGHFFTRSNGKLLATPLFLVLLVVESTDVLFAMDSIPAILAITRDPFIAYTSNIFAILGLRAMYFALSGLIGLFAYLRFGLAAVLIFVGVKMLLPLIHRDIPIEWSLLIVGLLLSASVVASLLFVKKPIEPPKPDDESSSHRA